MSGTRNFPAPQFSARPFQFTTMEQLRVSGTVQAAFRFFEILLLPRLRPLSSSPLNLRLYASGTRDFERETFPYQSPRVKVTSRWVRTWYELFMTTVEAKKIPRGSPSTRAFRSQLRVCVCSTLYIYIYICTTRKIRSRALTCFMVVETRTNKSLPRCLQSVVAVTPRRSPPSRHPSRRHFQPLVVVFFPPTGRGHRVVRFRYMRRVIRLRREKSRSGLHCDVLLVLFQRQQTKRSACYVCRMTSKLSIVFVCSATMSLTVYIFSIRLRSRELIH